MDDWQPIDSAPKDGTSVLIYWPNYNYDGFDQRPQSVMAIGRWKENDRLENSPGYFSDTTEWDDYGLAQPEYAPSHWMPLPEPPRDIVLNDPRFKPQS